MTLDRQASSPGDCPAMTRPVRSQKERRDASRSHQPIRWLQAAERGGQADDAGRSPASGPEIAHASIAIRQSSRVNPGLERPGRHPRSSTVATHWYVQLPRRSRSVRVAALASSGRGTQKSEILPTPFRDRTQKPAILPTPFSPLDRPGRPFGGSAVGRVVRVAYSR